MKLASGEKVLFIGDSITDAGRTGQFPPFGEGYVAFFRALMLGRHPELSLRIVNQGVAGNTIRSLVTRWESCVVLERPDHLVVMIGINDVWRAFAESERVEFHVPLAEFADIYGELLDRARDGGIGRIHLCGCFFVEPNREEPMRRMCEEYNAAVRKLAERRSLTFVDMQAVYDGLMRHQHPMAIAADRVHPLMHGHLAMAEELYRVLM